jgi:hypothetical protein
MSLGEALDRGIFRETAHPSLLRKPAGYRLAPANSNPQSDSVHPQNPE